MRCSISFSGGDENLFRYVHNSPTNAADASGLKVWQVARDLKDKPLGNHHYIVVIPDEPDDFEGNSHLTPLDGGMGATIGGFEGDQTQNQGLLVLQFNNALDVFAWNELDQWWDSYDPEAHEVPTPPGMTDTEFIQALLAVAEAYQANSGNAPEFNKFGPNCQSLASSLEF